MIAMDTVCTDFRDGISFPQATFSQLLSVMICSADGTNMSSEAAGFRVSVGKQGSLTARFENTHNYAGKLGRAK